MSTSARSVSTAERFYLNGLFVGRTIDRIYPEGELIKFDNGDVIKTAVSHYDSKPKVYDRAYQIMDDQEEITSVRVESFGRRIFIVSVKVEDSSDYIPILRFKSASETSFIHLYVGNSSLRR